MKYEYNHLCDSPTGHGHCTERLDKYHPRCGRHAVGIMRHNQYFRVSVHDVKMGDRIVL